MPPAPFQGDFAYSIYAERYKHPQDYNWAGTSKRTIGSVVPALYHAPAARGKHELIEGVAEANYANMARMAFVPGGRYLYAAGRDLHQVNNCILLRCGDSREGWAALSYKAEMATMTGAGIGVWYGDVRPAGRSIGRTGGQSSGPIGKMCMVNDAGRYLMQGGNRRCLPGDSMVTMADFSFKPIKDVLPGDMVLSRFGPRRVLAIESPGEKAIIQIDTAAGSVRSSEDHRWFAATTSRTKSWQRAKNFTVQHKLYRHPVPTVGVLADDDLDLAYVQGYFAGDGCAYSSGRTHEVTFQVADKWWRPEQNKLIETVMSRWGSVVARKGHGHCIEFRCRSKQAVLDFQKIKAPHKDVYVPREVINGGVDIRSAFLAGWWDADGSYTSDSWRLSNASEGTRDVIQALMQSLGLETSVSGIDVRLCAYQRPLFDATIGRYTHKKPSGHFSRQESSIPEAVTSIIRLPPEKVYDIQVEGEEFIADGFVSHNSAIWAGLPWWHADVFRFMETKDWPDWLRAKKDEDWNTAAPMDMTNISVTLDEDFFFCYGDAYAQIEDKVWAPGGGTWHEWAHRVYETAVTHMLRHGEPGFTVDVGERKDEVLRNACTEITSADDSDVCNLGSLVMPRFRSPREFGEAVRAAVGFLTAGTLYSHVPYRTRDLPPGNLGVDDIRDKNRRLGLGLMGVHELVMQAGVKYGTDEAFEVLDPWMAEYARALEYAVDFQDKLGLSRSVAATAIAPNGTIGAVAETTPSADTLMCAAKIQQVKSANVHGPDTFTEHVVVDPVAARLRAAGVPAYLIESAHDIAKEPERKLRQHAYMQGFVDQSISTTLNLPEVVTEPSEVAEFGRTLMKYLPRVKGITVYPDGARAGQPQTPVDLEWALEQSVMLEPDINTCSGGVCGI